MKRTDLERRDREVKRARKKEVVLERKTSREASSPSRTVGEYIDQLEGLFFHDDTKIYNIHHSIEILELLEDMRSSLPSDKFDSVLRKAIKKTGVKEREAAFAEVKELLGN